MDNSPNKKKYVHFLDKSKLLFYITLICFVSGFVFALINYLCSLSLKIIPLFCLSVVSTGCFVLLKFKHEELTTLLLITSVLSITVINMLHDIGLADSGIIGFPITLFVSSAILGKRSAVILAAIIIVIINILGTLELTHVHSVPDPVTLDKLLTFNVMIIITGISAYLIISQIEVQRRLISQQNKQLEKSIDEKTFLLKEVNHRIKNNLNILSSLLGLHRQKISNPGYKDIFSNYEKQIRTISLMHEKMYDSGNFKNVNLKDFLKDIIKYHENSAMEHGKNIIFDTKTENITLGIKMSISLVLLLNELITNSLKHAFNEKNEGVITIKISPQKEDHISMIYTDSGSGYRENNTNGSTLGMTLISSLGTQIDGETELRHEGEFYYKIVFPVKD